MEVYEKAIAISRKEAQVQQMSWKMSGNLAERGERSRQVDGMCIIGTFWQNLCMCCFLEKPSVQKSYSNSEIFAGQGKEDLLVPLDSTI